MKKKLVVFLIISLFSFSCYLVGFTLGKERDQAYQEMELLADVFSVIEQKYVEEKPIKDVVYGAISGIMSALDSYSQFLEPDNYKELLVETEGKFGGIGIEITIRDGLLTIVSPIEDTPGWEAGLKAGDIIVKIEDEVTKGITLNEAVKKLRGDPDTKVTITVLKERDKKLEDVTITRGIIKIKDIKRATIIDSDIGYVRLSEFRETTARDLDKALAKLNKKGMKALILDLRNNPGGFLDSAIDVASRFLDKGKVVVSTKSRDRDAVGYQAGGAGKKFLDIPMVVLINGGSASGSEIVAAALRENSRAITLGEKSFGKGSVQTIIPLSDGSALRMTTSKYFTPLGNDIHEEGIDPDIIVVEEQVAEEDIFEKIQEEKKKDFDYKTDYQIVRAVDLIKGLLVISSR